MVSMGGKLMKFHKILAAVFFIPGIIFSLLSSVPLTVFASAPQTEWISQLEGSLDISVFHEKQSDPMIQCFDVNEAGCYAIGYKNNTIHIYDSLGTFQYGYRFNAVGTYGLALKENSIVIYLVRSNTAVEIDPTGKCVDAQKLVSKDIADKVRNKTCKQIGNVSYYLERDIGIFDGDYSRLVKMDEAGNEIILYDVTMKGYFVGISHYIIVSIFPIAGITFVAIKLKKEE